MYDKLHYLNYKDNIYRSQIKRELIIYIYKSCCIDIRIKTKYRFLIINKFVKFLKLNKIKSRCIITGRSRFVFKYFHLNRNSLKFYSSFGYISGFKKY
jgi:ribosomal protein S14